LGCSSTKEAQEAESEVCGKKNKRREEKSDTFQVLSRQKDGAQVVVFDERADLRAH
jgi:hypothetical protein